MRDLHVWAVILFKYTRRAVKIERRTCAHVTDDGESCVGLACSSLPPVHSLYVVEIVVLQLLPLQLEGVCDQACLWGPRLRTQVDLQGNLKPLQLDWRRGQREGVKSQCRACANLDWSVQCNCHMHSTTQVIHGNGILITRQGNSHVVKK